MKIIPHLYKHYKKWYNKYNSFNRLSFATITFGYSTFSGIWWNFMFNNLKKYLLSELPNKIKLNHLTSYENFGKEIEPHISDIIEEYLDCKKIKFAEIFK